MNKKWVFLLACSEAIINLKPKNFCKPLEPFILSVNVWTLTCLSPTWSLSLTLEENLAPDLMYAPKKKSRSNFSTILVTSNDKQLHDWLCITRKLWIEKSCKTVLNVTKNHSHPFLSWPEKSLQRFIGFVNECQTTSNGSEKAAPPQTKNLYLNSTPV